MDIKILFEAFKTTWFITADAADYYSLIVQKLFAGETNLFEDKATEVMFMVNAEGKRITSAADAQGNGVAVLNLQGPVMKNDYCGAPGTKSLMSALQQANDNPAVSSIVLQIDSPGGSVDGTQQFADAIKNSAKPVVVYVDGLMASAAMWIGSAASQRIASSGTDSIGSIGTMAKWNDYSAMKKEMGIKTHEAYATNSTDKNKIFREAEGKNEDGKSNYEPMIKTWLDPANELFTNAIQQNLPDADKSVLSGGIYHAADAKKKGLIDKIGTFHDAVKSSLNIAKQQKQKSKPENMKWTKVLAFFGITTAVASAQDVTLTDAQLDNMEAAIAERDTLKAENATLKTAATAAQATIDAHATKITSLEAKVTELGGMDGTKFSAAGQGAQNEGQPKNKALEMPFQKELYEKIK